MGELFKLPRTEEEDLLTWKEKGLCNQVGWEIFFPEKGESSRPAKRICDQCDVRDQCLEYALENDMEFGVWGGMSVVERQKLKGKALDTSRSADEPTCS